MNIHCNINNIINIIHYNILLIIFIINIIIHTFCFKVAKFVIFYRKKD